MSDDYVVFITETMRYQILKSFDSQEEADNYAENVEYDEDDLDDIQVYRWAEAQ